MSNLSAFPFIQERSEATPGLWNNIFSILSSNLKAVDSNVSAFSGDSLTASSGTFSLTSNLSIGRDLWVKGTVTIGTPPSVVTRTALNIGVRSDTSDYLYLTDPSNLRSNYIIGSHVGGTADGLNIWDASGNTMIVSFSKQSIRFWQTVVGPVFDVGGAYFNVKAFGALGNGVADDWNSIQAAFDAARAAGGGQVFFPAGTYSISTKVRYGSRTHVRGVGPSSVLRNSATRSLPGIMLEPFASGTSLFALSEMVIDQRGDVFGNDASSNAVSVQQVQGAAIYNNTFRNIMTMAVWCDAPSFNTTTDIFIQNNVIENSWGGGFSVFGCMRNWAITGNIISDCRDDAIAIQGNSATKTGQDIVIANNVIRDLRSRGTATGVAGDATPRGILVQAAQNVSVIGNAIHRLVAGAIVVDDAPQHYKRPTNIEIVGNTITDTGSIITTGPTSGSTSGVPLNGIYIANGDVCSVVGNSISSCAQRGVWLQLCSKTVVMGNTCNDNNMDGINISDSSHIQIVGNQCINNAFNGSGDEPMGLVIISGSSLSYCEDLVIVGNTCTDTRSAGKTQNYGLYISGSSTSAVYAYQNILYGNSVGAIGGVAQPIRSRFAFNMDGDEKDKILNYDSGIPIIFGGPSYWTSGTAVLPGSGFSSEQSLGLYRSAASTIAVSYGTFTAPLVSATTITVTGPGPNAIVVEPGTGYGWRGLGHEIASSPGTGSFSSDARQFDLVVAPAGTTKLLLCAGSSGVPALLSLTTSNHVRMVYGQLLQNVGTNLAPTLAYSSESSLGLYSSGLATIAQSTGTFNLATNAVRLSMRTLAASSVTVSAANTNVATNEVVFTIGGASGASLCISSGGTTYIFSSALSAKNT